MPVPNATAVQTYTDQVAAKMRAALQGFANESTGKTLPSLYDQAVAGASGLAAGMGPQALATDRFGFPEQYNAQLAALFARADLVGQASGLVADVTGAGGGGYGSFSAYVADKGVMLDPLFAEIPDQYASNAANALHQRAVVAEPFIIRLKVTAPAGSPRPRRAPVAQPRPGR